MKTLWKIVTVCYAMEFFFSGAKSKDNLGGYVASIQCHVALYHTIRLLTPRKRELMKTL